MLGLFLGNVPALQRFLLNMTEPIIGSVVEFSFKGNSELGVIVVADRKLSVVNSDGIKRVIAPKQINFTPGVSLAATSSFEVIGNKLKLFDSRVSQRTEIADLATLWELVVDDSELMDLDEIAEMLFESCEPEDMLAAYRVMDEDQLYFKQKKNSFKPKSAQVVETILTMQKRQKERDETKATFVNILGQAVLTTDKMAPLNSDQKVYLDLIENYSILGDDFSKRTQADELLRLVWQIVGDKIQGRGPIFAFNLLVALEIFKPDENLLLRKFSIARAYSAEAVEQEQKIVQDQFISDQGASESGDWPDRTDLTHLRMFTVDAQETRDIDDALHIEEVDSGWIVGVHIADPAALIQPGEPLDLEARRRGVTHYLPTGSLPMFPASLSEGRMSLVAGQLRPALSFLLNINQEGLCTGCQVLSSVVRIAERLTYDETDEILEAEEHSHPLQIIYSLSQKLCEHRMSQGAISLSIPEVKVRVNSDFEVNLKILETDAPSRNLVSEMMVQAGAALGRFCADNQIPVIYRTQPPPIDDDAIDLSKYPKGLPREFAKRRQLHRGELSTVPDRHFGLGVEEYVQVTSPIRRYVDLCAHYQIKAFLKGDPFPFSAEQIMTVAATVDNLSSDATFIERETNRYWILRYLEENPEKLFTGVVLDWIGDRETRVGVFVNELGMKVNVFLREPCNRGDLLQLKVVQARAREDRIVLEPQ